jgi:hypothetical protein
VNRAGKWGWVVIAAVPLLMAGCGAAETPSGSSPANAVAASPLQSSQPTTSQTQPPGNESTGNPPSAGTETGTPEAEDLVPYDGPVEHIFFHPLIAYPKRAFDGDAMTQGYNDYFVTVPEFDKMLDALYRDHFILIDIRELFSLKQSGGKTVVVRKQLMLPKGKKPLILSIDDMNYYPYMIQNGNVNRLIVDDQGRIAAESTDEQGRTVVSYNNEIVPIVDAFVRAHPDFSYRGEKGMINLTGYAGVLGYRTNELNSPNYEAEKAAAENVIQHLKTDGWTFASHGWGHLDDARISYATFVADTDRWLREVGPLVGPTPVYVYPFGSRPPTGSPKWQYLVKRGFHVLCGVGPTTYVEWTKDALMMDRRHMDGIALHNQPDTLKDLFDAKQIIDPRRPPNY